MNLAEYLFKTVKEAGVQKIFGLPGDFAIPLFQTLDRLKMDVVTFTHEPALGYAADAYARLKGFAVAVTTYGAGALNMINAVAQAYAEKSPVLVISGAPEILSRKKNLLVHHRVKTFESQKRIFDEICCASTIIERLENAPQEIDYVISKILAQKRPGYIEVPRDICHCSLAHLPERPNFLNIQNPLNGDRGLGRMVEALVERINAAKNPLIYLGVEVKRLNLGESVEKIIEKTNLPFATSMEGKACVGETHPNFIGTYMGKVGSEITQKAMDEADLILNFGTMMSDVNLGMFTGILNVAKMVHITSDGLSIDGTDYPAYALSDVLEGLVRAKGLKRFDFPEHLRWDFPQSCHQIRSDGALTTDGIVSVINEFIRRVPTCITLDVGDILFAANNICADILLAPCYYASMGFAVPAAIAASLALPGRRAIALVGDGAFQMTGMEIGTAVRYGLNPIVIVMNNHGYETMRLMDEPRPYYRIPEWDFVELGKSLGVGSVCVRTCAELGEELKRLAEGVGPALIEAKMARDSASESLVKMSRSNKRFQKTGK